MLLMNNNFYVYAHQRKSDGECFYIGKGKGKRAYSKQGRSNYWHRIVNKHGYKVVILVNGISEEKAFALEKSFIEQIGRKNLCNATNGGEGISGYVYSEESKQKMSNKSFKHTEEYKTKMSKIMTGKKLDENAKQKISNSKKGNNFALGLKHSPESVNERKVKLHKSILQYDLEGNFIQEFPSTKIAAQALNCFSTGITAALKQRKKTAYGFVWKYKTK